jgi:Phage integrase, N-terminal SAM-like domain
VANTASDALLNARAEWLGRLQAEGKSSSTPAVYGSAVSSLADHVGNPSLEELTARHVRAFLAHALENVRQLRTHNRHRRYARSSDGT